MGWTEGSMIIGKDSVPEAVPSAIEGFDGCLLTVELHGHTHRLRVNKDQQQINAGHHNAGLSMKGTVKMCTTKLVSCILKDFKERAVGMPFHAPVPGVARPKHIDFVGESDCAFKAQLNEKKKAAMAAAYAQNNFGCASPSLLDCVAQRFGQFCAAKEGLSFTDPPAEFDATGAARAAARPPDGFTASFTEVMSQDSDIPSCLFGDRPFNILMPGTTKATYRHHTKDHKINVVMGSLGLEADDFTEDASFCWTTVEALHLAVCAHSGHDCHWRWDPASKTWKNTTGIGAVGLKELFLEAGEKIKSGSVPFRRASQFPAGTSTLDVALWVCRWLRSVIDPKWLEKGGGCLKDPLVVENVVRGFVEQSVACSVGKSGTAPFHAAASVDSPLVLNDTDLAGLGKYTYSGCCKFDTNCDVGESADPNHRWCTGKAMVFQSVLSVERGDAAGHSPKATFASMIAMVKKNQAECEWGKDFDHEFEAINLCVEMIDRAKHVTKLQVATVPNASIPPSSPAKDNQNVGMTVVKMASVQSYGIQAHVKDREMDKGSYNVSFAVEFDIASGKILMKGGSGTGGIGVHAPLCRCKSPFPCCRHIVSGLVAISRLSAEHCKTATSGDKYWAAASEDPTDDNPENKALPISELCPNYVCLSDIMKRPMAEDEVEELLGWVERAWFCFGGPPPPCSLRVLIVFFAVPVLAWVHDDHVLIATGVLACRVAGMVQRAKLVSCSNNVA